MTLVWMSKPVYPVLELSLWRAQPVLRPPFLHIGVFSLSPDKVLDTQGRWTPEMWYNQTVRWHLNSVTLGLQSLQIRSKNVISPWWPDHFWPKVSATGTSWPCSTSLSPSPAPGIGRWVGWWSTGGATLPSTGDNVRSVMCQIFVIMFYVKTILCQGTQLQKPDCGGSGQRMSSTWK